MEQNEQKYWVIYPTMRIRGGVKEWLSVVLDLLGLNEPRPLELRQQKPGNVTDDVALRAWAESKIARAIMPDGRKLLPIVPWNDAWENKYLFEAHLIALSSIFSTRLSSKRVIVLQSIEDVEMFSALFPTSPQSFCGNEAWPPPMRKGKDELHVIRPGVLEPNECAKRLCALLNQKTDT